MKLYVFFSVHERVFGPIVETLRREYGVSACSGFVWGNDQRRTLESEGTRVSPLTIFSRDILDKLGEGPVDLAYLSDWEQRCGIPLQHMIFAERHLLGRYTYEQVLKIAELVFKRAEADFDSVRPDVYFSEDVACLTSYIHWAVAKDRGVRILLINNSRFPKRVTTYSNPFQQWDLLDAIFPDTPAGTLSAQDLDDADAYIRNFRERPAPPPGLLFRSRLNLGNRFDLGRLSSFSRRWFEDAQNPTLRSPTEVVMQRGRRLVRSYLAEALSLFESPRAGEQYVLYPLHYQPEATTLVLAPYYLNQVALIEDIAKSLPAGFRLYVKEHIVSRGRWPLEFYAAIRRVPGVRLLSPNENTWALVRGAAAIAVITGTMGWEGILIDKPVVTFGRVFYNRYPLVYRAGELTKHAWPEVFRRAIFAHRSDPELLRRFVACSYKATAPGLTGNPASLPEILEPENIRKLVRVVASRLGLTNDGSHAENTSWSA
jgi:hypothetical protein